MARPKVSKRIGNYGNDFKVKAVRLTFMENTQVQEIAKALDIHPFMAFTLAERISGRKNCGRP